MSLNTGDIIEGIYQLEEKVFVGEQGQCSRWLADDITSYRRSEVLIDTIPADYVADLHWKADKLNVRLAGQSADCDCRYIVWDQNPTPTPIVRYEPSHLSNPIRKRLASLIDSLPVGVHETLVAQDFPEYWHDGTNGILIFYRKVVATLPSSQTVREIKEHWKQALFARSMAEPIPEIPPEKAMPSPSNWPIFLSVIGVLLALSVYSLRSQMGPDPVASQSASQLTAFRRAFEQGIVYEKKGAYPEAVESFETAVREAPASETIDARLDSLAQAYATYAQAECTRYHGAGSEQLYFIPNQYYHYAAILSRNHTIHTCE
ncbi:hypothetical protein [Salmonirosea aquatica]|uniref:Uncharacterized protein n=1 Tax=Salmonirosea aquatica TaxID=2654236 RepID=A0A7C9FZF7_9BACT|nr:hypothetical protein [Cytophagaceae bacterium SJW1-29]